MHEFLWGCLTVASVTTAIIFLRYWRLTGDRLFACFAVAFTAMALNWLGLGVLRPTTESQHAVYLLRLAAFVLIIAGVIDKNIRRRRDSRGLP